MIESAKPECIVPMKCDADSFKSWYLDVYESNLKEEYAKLCENNSKEKSFELLCSNHEEMLEEQLEELIGED